MNSSTLLVCPSIINKLRILKYILKYIKLWQLDEYVNIMDGV